MPIVLIDDDELFEYPIGDESDATVFLWRRLLYREREELAALYVTRGRTDERAYHNAYVAMALQGWRNLWGRNGQIVYPTYLTLPSDRYAAILDVVEHLPLEPLDIMDGLYKAIREPTHEQLLKNLNGFLTVNGHSSSATEPSIAVPSAAPNAPPAGSPSPVTTPLDA